MRENKTLGGGAGNKLYQGTGDKVKYTPKGEHCPGGRGTALLAPPLVLGLLACEGFTVTLVAQVKSLALASPEFFRLGGWSHVNLGRSQ